MLSILSSFSRSPSISLVTGMPVHLPTIFAISSSSTVSLKRLWPSLACSSASLSCFCSSGRRPYFSSAALFRSYSFSALSMLALVLSISSRSLRTLTIASFSLSHLAFISANCALSSESSFWVSSSLAFESWSVSFLSAASAISCCIILRDISSSSVGIESISVLMRAHASSTRSMALSGRNLSVIYLLDKTAAAISALSWIFTPWKTS